MLIPVPGVANLSLLAGDTRMTSPMGILDSPKMRSLLERTRTLADYVIIDAPPAGLLADAAVLCRSADQVLYVVRYDSFARNQVADAMHSVSGRGAELTGYVINGRPTRRGRGYGYGYDRYGYGKYGYGTKYGYGKNGSRKQDNAHGAPGGPWGEDEHGAERPLLFGAPSGWAVWRLQPGIQGASRQHG